MKKILSVLALTFCLSIASYAQVAIGTNTPSPSAQFEVYSTERGFLPPRMTSAQRDSIATPATGLLIFQTNNTAGYYYYNGTAWVSLSAIGPQGPQGPTGLTGPAGVYSAGNGIIINNNTISVNPTTSNQSSQGVRIGFTNSTSWVCPNGVNQIKVEVWGAGGGGGSGSFGKNNLQCGVLIGTTYHGETGGAGGTGGYNSSIIQVIPGQTYSITIGQGGAGGVYNISQLCPSIGSNGLPGQETSFNGILNANAGQGGQGGVSNYLSNSMNSTTYSSAPSGSNGTVLNFNYSVPNYGTRSFIPSNYLTPIPNCCANGGGGGQRGYYNHSSSYFNPQDGQAGENGYCVISY